MLCTITKRLLRNLVLYALFIHYPSASAINCSQCIVVAYACMRLFRFQVMLIQIAVKILTFI